MEENEKEQELVDNNEQTEGTDGSLNYEVEVSLEETEEQEILDKLSLAREIQTCLMRMLGKSP